MANKKPNTLETLRLSLEVLRTLSKTSKKTTAQIAEQVRAAGFERDERSIQRLLATLADAFEDIERDDTSTPFGYRWRSSAEPLVLPRLTPQESLLLALAKRQIQPLLPPQTRRQMGGFFDQAQYNLRHNDKATLEKQWLGKVRVVSETQPLLSPHIADGVLDAVSGALFANLWLSVDYTNQKNERKQSLVMPLGLVQQGPRLYLVCQYQGHTNQRLLALHRMQAATITPTRFERPDFDLAAYQADGQLAVANGPWIQLTFELEKGAAKHLLESRLSEDQSVEDLGSHLRLTATVKQTLLLDRWLNSFGGQIQNIQKAEVNKEINS